MNFIDTHLHLASPEFRSDLDEVIKRANISGIRYMITIGSGYGAENFDETIKVADRYNLFYAIGVHPHDANLQLSSEMVDDNYNRRLESIFAKIRVASRDKRMIAIGEIGLDYYYRHSGIDIQKETFARVLNLAVELKVPVIIHSRDAFDDTIDIIKAMRQNIPGGVFHCYTGDVEQARIILDMGFFISLSGIVTFKKAVTVQEVARFLPLDRILIETDAPFLAPEPYRGRRNEPAFIIETYKKVAEIRNMDIENLADAVLKNAIECFDLRSRRRI